VGTKRKKLTIGVFIALAVTLSLLLVFTLPIATLQAATQDSGYDYGDLNRIGGITTADRGWLNQMILLTRAGDPIADVNMDGRITTADRGLLNQIILLTRTPVSMWQAAYDFSTGAGTRHLAKSKSLASMPTSNFSNDSGWTDFITQNYSDVAAVDAAAFTLAGVGGNMSAVQCRFDIDEKPCTANLTSMDVQVVGNVSTNSSTMQYWVWNFTSGAWVKMGTDITIGTTEATNTKYSAAESWQKTLTNYIATDGSVYVLVIITTTGVDLTIDYIKLTLETGDTTCPYPTPSITP